MKKFDHDTLHAMIDNPDADPSRKLKFAALHALDPVTMDEWFAKMRQTVTIFAEAVDCRHGGDALEFLEEVLKYIQTVCVSKDEWFAKYKVDANIVNPIRTVEERYVANRQCHAVGGSSYTCYCDER